MTGKGRWLFAASLIVVASVVIAALGLRSSCGPAAIDSSDRDPTGSTSRATSGDTSVTQVEREPYDPEIVDKTIQFWKSQADRDPEGALERRDLATAYLARFRETGNIADAVAAEAAARDSLRLLPRSNAHAMIRLSRSLIAQHRFPEALKFARVAAALDPEAGRLVADILLELGDYEAAGRTLSESQGGSEDMNYLALRSRLEQINGNSEYALKLLKKAQGLADSRPDMPAEAVAWYHTMVGHALIDSGKLDEGERACQNALKIFPRDYRAMTSLADVAAWRGDWKSTIAWGEKALAIGPQNPQALRVVGDAHAALGEQEAAQKNYDRLKELAHSFPRIYDRHWALFCADQGNDLDEALELARNDLELRHDIHAYDTLAWVYFKKGMLKEAEKASESSLATGTQEATLLYHAGMIARASGHLDRARDCFTRAREINPKSVPIRWIRWLETKTG